ncbi:expressed unknown protein [Seminavis robusta]|uniref:Uncharacterized protein n=1 Tax=Seminavis robusta TaxID=568900 RepID=A0A9N8DGA4_9STRA|nr:expressed unknown protein [Seminavis robusta]|eukprot:Sro143_g066710.1 n/a (442) ;mRNA; r:76208-77899
MYGNPPPTAPHGGGAQPKKYVKVNGVMKLNPDYKRWKEGQGVAATTVPHADQALPVVTNMEDHDALNQASIAAGGPEIPLSESTNATIEMMQEPEISGEAGMSPETMVDELGAVLNKYEVPMGLMNKLMMLSEFEYLEFMIDDSGSMTLPSDTVDPATGKTQTRWQEAKKRLKEMIEVLAYVPFNQIVICFLNRPDRVLITRNGRAPPVLLADCNQQIDALFNKMASGSTPFLERLQESFARGANRNVARYFFGDGVPNGGNPAKAEVVKILCTRQNPEGNPMTFLSCTNEDAQVEWMKDTEELAPYCSECDDFKDEADEVLKDQGVALPYSYGFYLVSCLVAAMNPDDLDAMDESVPFTKGTLDNLLGIESNEASYKHYFDCFIQAQQKRTIENDDYGRPKKTDQLKKSQNWQALYGDFLRAPEAKMIPAVQQFKQALMS